MSTDPSSLFDWVMEVNLQEILRFHNTLRFSIDQRAGQLTSESVGQSEIDNHRDYLATNSFLMVYSYCEEYLYLLWKSTAKEIDRKSSGYSINRYEPVLCNLGIPTDNSSWRFLLEATEVRHCLLHANGRLDLMKDRRKIDAIVARFSSGLKVAHERLQVRDDFCKMFVDEVRTFRALIERAKSKPS